MKGCRFRACQDGIYIDGANANVQKNTFSGQREDDFSIDVDGPDAVVKSNRMIHGSSGSIEVDAESGGSASVTNNTIDTMGGDDCRILVENADGAVVSKNVFKNFYLDGNVIDVTNCDDAGVYVEGHRASITKNHFENLNNYDSDIYVIDVDGNEAVITSNKIRICGAGEDYDTIGINVSGNYASVTRNTITDMAGGGDETYGVYISGTDGTVDSNKISYLNDEYTYGVYYSGDRATVTRTRSTT